MVAPRLQIVVVGAGPIGLAAAWQLSRKGHKVTVVERKHQLDAMGGDIQMSPNATLLSRKIGLAPLLEDIMNPKQSFLVHDNDPEMSMIFEVPIGFGSEVPSLMFRRSRLQQRLYDIVIEAGVTVKFGKQVISLIDSETQPELMFADGDEITADMVVAADGVRSSVRTQAFADRDTRPIALNEVCFQWNVPYSTMAANPETLAFWEEGKRCCGVVVSSGTYLTYWSNEVQQEMFLIFTKPDYHGPAEVGFWNKPANQDEVKRLFQDYPRPIRTLVEKCFTAEHWRITDSVKGADWVTPGGRIVLVGDAKHSMPPHQAQGVGQGLEDVVALSEFIEAATSIEDLKRVFQAFGAFREPRVELILQSARSNSALFCLPPGNARQARDAAWKGYNMTSHISKAWNAASTSWQDVTGASMGRLNFIKWVQTYDVLEEARQYIEKHLAHLPAKI